MAPTLLAQRLARIVDQNVILRAREIGGEFAPDRRRVCVRVHHPGLDPEAVAAQDLSELAQLQPVVALRPAVDQD